MTQRTVLVTGATGNQGGAVTDALLAQGHTVRALVRDASKPKAQALAARGVELVEGNLDDGASVEAAARGVDAVFVNTSPFAPGVGTEGEKRMGRIVLDALQRAEVPHVVYSSVSDANRQTGIPHFESKADAEAYLEELGLPYTVTAPVYFTDNLVQFWNVPDLKAGRLRQAMPADRALQVVSLRDIGRFNAAVITRGPEELAGMRINYASDELTPSQMTAAIAQASGRDMAFEQQPMEEVRAMMEEMALMYEWFDRVGYTADVAGLRADFPEVEWMSFADWAGAQDWDGLLAEPSA